MTMMTANSMAQCSRASWVNYLLIWLLQHWKAGENSLPGRVAAVRVGELGSGQCRPRTAPLPVPPVTRGLT